MPEVAPQTTTNTSPRPDRPTIAHVLHRLHVAGAEVLAADLSRRLADRYRFIFLCLDGVGPLGEELRSEGFTVIELGRRPGVDLSVGRRIRRAVRQHSVALLHAHQYTPFFYAAASRLVGGMLPIRSKPPILFTEHGRTYPDYRRRKRVWANRFLLKPNDRVTAVGQFVKQALVSNEGLARDRIGVIYNGIDARKFSLERVSPAGDRQSVRAGLGLAPDQPVLLQVARFHPVKDHATSIRALAQVVREMPNALLLLAGDGEKLPESKALARELGVFDNVRFLGVRGDIPRLMAVADVFVLSSLSEGISVTLLEAKGLELPIAATDVGGNAEVVAHGTTGLLSPRGDPERLAHNLITLLRDPAMRRRMGSAGRERLLAQFTQEQMHEQYARLYSQMV